jgi:hypothetical protein
LIPALLFNSLLLLLALGMRLIGMLMRGLRMLLGACGVFFALGVVALAVMFGGGTMCLGSVFVVFGGLVMFVFSHEILFGLKLPVGGNTLHPTKFQSS